MPEPSNSGVTRKLEVLQSEIDDEKCITFVLNGEDHTLGNSLRYILMKNPDVKFCGYAVPHPSENKINLRLQTFNEPANQVLKWALETIHEMCGYILNTFQAEVETFSPTTPGVEKMEVT